MKPQTTTLTKPTLDLPKSWQNAKVVVDFPDDVTIVVKKADSNAGIDYAIDEKNWSGMKDGARSARDEVFKQFYPELYGEKQRT